MYTPSPPGITTSTPSYQSQPYVYLDSNYDESERSTSSNGGGLSYQSSHNPADVPTAVRALLLGTNQLRDVLRKWSIGQATEVGVSDVYVQLGTDFNTVVQAFGRYGVDMSDLLSVPKDLRSVLEQCLGEDPTPHTLAAYWPEVRQVLFTLLEGLKVRQPIWKAAIRRV